MILDDSELWEIDHHKIEYGNEKKHTYLVYSYIDNRGYINNTCDEDVLMIYCNDTNNRIYLDERFTNGTVDLSDWLKEFGVKDRIVVLGYDRETFENKYFTVLI